MEYQDADLMTIAGGAISEMFAVELQRVLDNIDDLNTDPKKRRTITIEIGFEPDNARQAVQTAVSVKSKLASPNAAESTLYIVRGNGALRAVANSAAQTDLFRKVAEQAGAENKNEEAGK